MKLEPLKTDDEVIILGAGRSGIAAARLLLSRGIFVTLIDDAPETKLSRFCSSDIKDHPKLKTFFGPTRSPLQKNARALILSPGICLDHPAVKEAQNLGIALLNELDLAFSLMKGYTIIGVTGTNGKSTTTVMLENILRCANKSVWAGGNLGSPWCDMVLSQEHFAYVVLELSSYQLEALQLLRLDAAIILNITPDHLDRYASMADYTAAKMRIIGLLKTDRTLIINSAIDAAQAFPQQIRFSSSSFAKGQLSFLEKLTIAGEHMRENATAAALCALGLGLEPQAILEGLHTFKALPHRCEFIAKKGGITFINDSKGTTVDAVKKALSMTKGPVHLLLGGLAKGESFDALGPHYFPHISRYYIFGQAKEKILSEIMGAPTHSCENLREAFQAALKNASKGHTILLSPGCASFDQFTDFNERGDFFRKLVLALE